MTEISMSSRVVQELMADAKGYGTLVALYCGQNLLWAGDQARGHKPAAPQEADAFISSLYCQVTATRRRRLYRAFDQFSHRPSGWKPPIRRHGMTGELRKSAFAEGGERGLWLAAARPYSAQIYRPWSAVKTEWNRMDYLLTVEMRSGATFFVGRAAPQHDAGRLLHGGGIQIFVPDNQRGYLRLLPPEDLWRPWTR